MKLLLYSQFLLLWSTEQVSSFKPPVPQKTITVMESSSNADAPTTARFYPIGTPGKPWTEEERTQWKAGTKIQRSYKDEVLDKVEQLKADFDVETYGALSHNPEHYPLMVVKSRNWKETNPYLLVTGGIHGYETSGVQGALEFLQTKALKYANDFNILVAPCVSPWAYEHIQRWQADVLDTNRSFQEGKETEESKALIGYLNSLAVEKWTCHLDLHETTDSDATEFMPAKHAEAGLLYTPEVIPDGFYLVADALNSQLDFQKAVIESVRQVTHIAPPDGNGNIIDEPIVAEGVISVPVKKLGLCCSVTGGTYVTTTEVYPNSPNASDEICNQAQVAAITGALEFIRSSQ
jgi:hypothetical protein